MKNLILILSCLPLFLFAHQADAQSKSLTPTKEKTTGFKIRPSKELAKRLLPPPDKKIYDAMVKAGNCQPCSTKSTAKGKVGSTNDVPEAVVCIVLNTYWGPVLRCLYQGFYCDTFLNWNISFCYLYPSGW